MPPKGKKKTPKKKREDSATPDNPPPQFELGEEAAEEEKEGEGREGRESTQSIDEKLTTFLEDRLYFSDIFHEQYTNKRRKAKKLVALSAAI